MTIALTGTDLCPPTSRLGSQGTPILQSSDPSKNLSRLPAETFPLILYGGILPLDIGWEGQGVRSYPRVALGCVSVAAHFCLLMV
jgi:hypothetical protein